jgi:hypothetical protein
MAAAEQAGNRVIAFMEARADELVYCDDKHRELADRLESTGRIAAGPIWTKRCARSPSSSATCTERRLIRRPQSILQSRLDRVS